MPRLPCLLLVILGLVNCAPGPHRDTDVRVYGPFAVGDEATLTIWRTDTQPNATTCKDMDVDEHPCDKVTGIQPRVVSVDCDGCTVLRTTEGETPTVFVTASQPGAHTVAIDLEDPDGTRSTAEVDVHFALPDHIELSRYVSEPFSTSDAVLVGTSLRWRASLRSTNGRAISTRWAVDTGDGAVPVFNDGSDDLTFTVSAPGIVSVAVKSHDGLTVRRTLRVIAREEIASAELREVSGLPGAYDARRVPLEAAPSFQLGPPLREVVTAHCGASQVYALRLHARDGTTVFGVGNTVAVDPPSLVTPYAFPGLAGPFLTWRPEAEGAGYLRGTLGTLAIAIPIRTRMTCATP